MKFCDFTNLDEILKILTAEDAKYPELTEFAENLTAQIPDLHVNQDGHRYHAVTQCILECLRRKNGYKSFEWVSENKLKYELKQGEKPNTFTRINSNQEVCLYKIINFDQIDFSKEIEFADEYEVVGKTEKASQKQNVTKPKENLAAKNLVSEDNRSYLQVLSLLHQKKNVFLTGFAGTGKSYILNKLKEHFKKKLTITSTTGIAAVNIKGQTLHSWAGVGLCKNTIANTIEKIRGRATQLRQILNCKILAVDEISMLNIDAFEYVNEVLKGVRESTEPFGGIQVLFIGDFFQLPPVEKEEPETRYCFDSPVWDDLNLQNVVLKKNYRQSQENFITALEHMRENRLDSADIQLLQSRTIEGDMSENDILHIFSTNEEANRYNNAKFNMIDEPVRIFEAVDGVYRGKKLVYDGFTESEKYILEIFSKNCRAEREIALKLGAKVMLLINMDFNKGLINGACGSIQGFFENSINIKFDNGITAQIPKHTFEYYYNERVIAQRAQYPLKLAYGITIHKSQGMTLDKLVVDCARIFERGQAYVAMSRVKTLEGLYLRNFDPQKVMVDSKVARFYEDLKETLLIENDFTGPAAIEEEESLQISDEEAKKIILECIDDFSGLYGKSGFCKILTGSSSIKDNGYNGNVISSKHLGALKGITQKAIGNLIDEMIEDNILNVRKISFGRPVLTVNRH